MNILFLKQIAIFNFKANKSLKLSAQILDLVFIICKLNNIIKLKNSINVGEINLCELNN